jgi:hypothetical protein
VTGLAESAAQAYLAGWALTGAPFTERIEAGCIAAVECALEHPRDPGILEATLQLGHLTGVWQTVYDRRERLLRKNLRAVTAAWDACIADLDPRDVVKRFRSAIYLPAEAVTKDPTKRWRQDTAIATALGWLRGVYHSGGYDALVAALEDAIREGMAEGEAGALALAASRQGKTGFRIDDAFKAAYQRLADDHSVTQQAADAATAIIDGAAGDTGRRLASMAGDGASEDEMTAAAADAVSGATSRSLKTWLSDHLWAGILAGAVALYKRLPGTGTGTRAAPAGPDTPPGGTPPSGPVLLDWITAGDGRVCPTCSGYEDNSPYAPEDVPDFPHPGCRCSVDLESGPGSSSFLTALLDSFSN